MKAKMATKEQRSITIHDAFVNKLCKESGRITDHSMRMASDEIFLGWKLG